MNGKSGAPVKTRRQWFTTEPAVAGSKRWYREKRLEHLILWIMPLIPIGYTLSSQSPVNDAPMGWPSMMLMLLPVMGSAAALGFVSHALWRIEINVAGNREHPFTTKDARVLSRSGWILIGSLLFAFTSSFILTRTMDLTGTQDRLIDTALSVAVVVGMVGAVLIATMRRIHRMAQHAYEELEKGV